MLIAFHLEAPIKTKWKMKMLQSLLKCSGSFAIYTQMGGKLGYIMCISKMLGHHKRSEQL